MLYPQEQIDFFLLQINLWMSFKQVFWGQLPSMWIALCLTIQSGLNESMNPVQLFLWFRTFPLGVLWMGETSLFLIYTVYLSEILRVNKHRSHCAASSWQKKGETHKPPCRDCGWECSSMLCRSRGLMAWIPLHGKETNMWEKTKPHLCHLTPWTPFALSRPLTPTTCHIMKPKTHTLVEVKMTMIRQRGMEQRVVSPMLHIGIRIKWQLFFHI